MAKDKKDKKKGKRDKEAGAGKELSRVGADLRTAMGTGNDLGIFTDSDKLDTKNLEALLDPSSPGYIGTRSIDDKNNLEALTKNVQRAGDRSAEMTDLLNLFKGGLQGLNAEENTALRESSQREVNREYETGMYELQKAQSRNRTRSAASNRQVMDANRNKFNDTASNEQDLLLKNMDVQDKRRSAYGDALTGAEKNEFDRTQDALRSFSDALGSTENREDARIYNTRNQFLDSSKFNIDQSGKDKAAKVAGATGLLGLAYTERNNNRNYKLTKSGMASSRRSGDGRTSTSTGGNSNQQLIDALTGLGQKQFGEDATV